MQNFILPPNGVTLNGVPAATANEIVKNFTLDPTSSDDKTAIWLNKKWVDNVYRIIKGEGGDGIRIYYAKREDNRRNTVVIVSTYSGGMDLNAETKADHYDYFIHDDPFFLSTDAILTEEWDVEPGATLFNPQSPCTPNSCVQSYNYISCDNGYLAVSEFRGKGANQPINTFSEWFSLSFFENLSTDMDAESSANPGEPADGIRIYFAKHTQATTAANSHKGRHSFIIATTKIADVDGIPCHKDYYQCYNHATGDNGEQCLNNCTGARLPA